MSVYDADIAQFFGSLRRYSFSWLDLIGQDQWSDWTPSRPGWTDVGSPTVTGRYRTIGHKCEFQVKIVPGTTCATVAGTSYMTLPLTAAGLGGEANMINLTTLIAVGLGVIDVTNSLVYVPTQTATGNTLVVSGWFEI